MKNKISKIILISTLLLSTMATAKNFYTCVPKKEWVEKVIQEKEDKNWELINKNFKLDTKEKCTNISKVYLESGNIYKFVESKTGKSYILSIPFSGSKNYLEEIIASSSCKSDLKRSVFIGGNIEFPYSLCDVFIKLNFLGKISVKTGEDIIIKIYKKM